jgi:hypothetical protein
MRISPTPFSILIAFQAGALVNDLHKGWILFALILSFLIQFQEFKMAIEKERKQNETKP